MIQDGVEGSEMLTIEQTAEEYDDIAEDVVLDIEASSSDAAEEQAANDSDSDASEACDLSVRNRYRYPLHEVEEYVTNKLHQACLTANVGEVRVLLSEGTDVNEAGKNSWTPLHFGGRGGSAEIVQLLLDCGAKVTANSQSHTVWQIAAAFGWVDIVRIYGCCSLKPASIFAEDSPCCVAARKENVECVKVLFEAVIPGNEKILRMLLKERGSAIRLLRNACGQNNFNRVKFLLQHGAKAHNAIVDHAIEMRRPEILALLLQHGANPRGGAEEGKKDPFQECLEEVQADIVLVFVEHEKNTQGFISGSTLTDLLESKQPQLYVSVLFDALTMQPGEKPDCKLIPPRSLYTSCVTELDAYRTLERFSRPDTLCGHEIGSDVLPSHFSWTMRLIDMFKDARDARLPKPLAPVVYLLLLVPWLIIGLMVGAEFLIRRYITEKKSARTAEACVFTIKLQEALRAEFLQLLVTASETMGSPDPIFADDSVAALVEFHWCLYGKFSHSCAFQLFVAQLFLFTFLIAAFRDFNAAGAGKQTFGWALQGILCSLVLYSITVELRTARKLGIGHLTTPWTVMALSGSALVLLGQAMFLALGVPNGQADVVNSIAAVVMWFSLLYYLLPYQSTGPLVRMILMIISDIRAFLGILFIVIIGFATAFYAILGFTDSSNCDDITNSTDYELCVAITQDNAPGSFSSPGLALRSSFSSMFGGYDLQELDDSPSSVMLTLLWVAFMLTVSIVLLNILIAIISDSFERLIEGSKSAWLLGKAKATMKMHTLMSNKSKKMLDKYLEDKDTLYILRPKAEEGSSGGDDWNGRVSAIVNRVKESTGEIRSDVSGLKESNIKIEESNAEIKSEVRSLAETSNQQNTQVKDLIGKVDAIESQLTRLLEVMHRLDTSFTKPSID